MMNPEEVAEARAQAWNDQVRASSFGELCLEGVRLVTVMVEYLIQGDYPDEVVDAFSQLLAVDREFVARYKAALDLLEAHGIDAPPAVD